MNELPWTPDFYQYQTVATIKQAITKGDYVTIVWADGLESQYHVFMLRENSPDPQTIHEKSREMLISPLDIPSDLKAISVEVESNGALAIEWSTGTISQYHPGWLREYAWFVDGNNHSTLPAITHNEEWDANTLSAPPSFNGPEILNDDKKFLSWLEAISTYGIARLRGLPDQNGLLEKIVRTIGSPRESNFGPLYILEIKDEPNSNAFTSGALLQHIDMPTRECPHGLQFLFCRRNTTIGGEGVYVDGFRIARELNVVKPAIFKTLTTIPWVFNNRSRTSDYRAESPIIVLDSDGELKEIRLTAWLRGPLKASLKIQRDAYHAVRVLTHYMQNPKYQLTMRYKPGDLLAFDNRRVLHGRRSYEGSTGERFIEGIYADRDELYSKIRILRRKFSN